MVRGTACVSRAQHGNLDRRPTDSIKTTSRPSDWNGQESFPRWIGLSRKRDNYSSSASRITSIRPWYPKPRSPAGGISTTVLARIIHDGSSRNREVAWQDGHVEARETKTYLKQYVDVARGEPAHRRLVVAANLRLQ